MQYQMKIIVVSHPNRAMFVAKLQEHLPVAAVIVDDVNAFSGHTLALKCAMSFNERVIIMEDDAIPVKGFCDKAQTWFDRYPQRCLSFYLGTGRPPHMQGIVSTAIERALELGHDCITLYHLLHGVCYSLPVGSIPTILRRMRYAEPDRAIGDAWGQSVIYPIESLVEHRDTKPVEQHPDGQPRVERRVARRLAGELMYKP